MPEARAGLPENEGIDTAEFQAALAHILVDPSARRRFEAEPERFRRDFALTDAQLAALQAVGPKRLRQFAQGAATKRFELIERRCPNTFALLERHDLRTMVVDRFLAEELPWTSTEELNRITLDFSRLAEMIDRLLHRGELSCPYLEEILRCERVQDRLAGSSAAAESARAFKTAMETRRALPPEAILAARPRTGEHLVIEAFSCGISEIMRRLTEKVELPPWAPLPTTLIFLKVSGSRKIQIISINEMTRRFLEMCDGEWTTTEIATALQREAVTRQEPMRFRERCVDLVQEMARHAVLWLDERE